MLPMVKLGEKNTFVPSSVIAELWIASINVFGCTITEEQKRDSVFSTSEEILNPTKAWVERDTAQTTAYNRTPSLPKDTMAPTILLGKFGIAS